MDPFTILSLLGASGGISFHGKSGKGFSWNPKGGGVPKTGISKPMVPVGSDVPYPEPEMMDPADLGSLLGLVPMAHGGVVTRPTPALLGEDGPEMVVPLRGLDPREMFLRGVESGDIQVPSVSDLGRAQRRFGGGDSDPEVEAILNGEPPHYTPEMENEDPRGFWGKLGELGGVTGNIDLRHSGPLGALIALGGMFANVKAAEANREREGRVERNKQRRDESMKMNMESEQRDRAFRLERLRLLGQARRFARGEDESGARSTYVPGAGYVPTSSQLAQRYLTHQAENAGTKLAPRWRENEGESNPRPAPIVSSLEEQDAEDNYKRLLNDWRANFWWKRSGGSPESYATWANAPLPTDEQARAEADPKVRGALTNWKRATVLRVARNARSQEDLDDLEAALERAPAEVRADPRVLRAVQDAAARIH